MAIYLAVTPERAREAAGWTNRLAHVAYRVDREGHLAWRGLLMGCLLYTSPSPRDRG